uniref:Uncharacterized protein n=1 Tax=uncultured myxobacterium HF0200_08J13 TaxID=723558 RepID=E7C3N3_9BACT|nr:hypothetical protein [uncultured myxobacterium HF0200_08J13]
MSTASSPIPDTVMMNQRPQQVRPGAQGYERSEKVLGPKAQFIRVARRAKGSIYRNMDRFQWMSVRIGTFSLASRTEQN